MGPAGSPRAHTNAGPALLRELEPADQDERALRKKLNQRIKRVIDYAEEHPSVARPELAKARRLRPRA